MNSVAIEGLASFLGAPFFPEGSFNTVSLRQGTVERRIGITLKSQLVSG